MTATIAGAFSALETLGSTVTGVTKSYGLSHFFDKFLGIELPCLVVAPDLENEPGFATLAFLGNAGYLRFTALHILLYAPFNDQAVLTGIMPGLVGFIDTYTTALAALPFLAATTAPAVHQPSACSVQIGVVKWGEIAYHALTFKHQLEINL